MPKKKTRIVKSKAQKLFEIRDALELNQTEFGNALGIRGPYAQRRISDMETLRVPIPSYIMRCAELLLENTVLRYRVGEDI